MASSSTASSRAKLPRIGAASLNGVVVIEIAADRQKYHVHNALLVHHSEYFAKALNGTWKEANEGVVTLEDVEPAVFSIYIHRLYHQQLPLYKNWEEWIAITDPARFKQGRFCFTKIKAYGFGDRFLDADFRLAMNQAIIKDLKWEMCYPLDAMDIVNWAFENIPSDCPLLQLLVNHFCDKWNSGTDVAEDAVALKQMPRTFSVRVMSRLSEMRSAKTLEHGNACYLEHATDDERQACKKPHVHYDKIRDYGYLKIEES